MKDKGMLHRKKEKFMRHRIGNEKQKWCNKQNVPFKFNTQAKKMVIHFPSQSDASIRNIHAHATHRHKPQNVNVMNIQTTKNGSTRIRELHPNEQEVSRYAYTSTHKQANRLIMPKYQSAVIRGEGLDKYERVA